MTPLYLTPKKVVRARHARDAGARYIRETREALSIRLAELLDRATECRLETDHEAMERLRVDNPGCWWVYDYGGLETWAHKPDPHQTLSTPYPDPALAIINAEYGTPTESSE